ncbi:MAG TPA: large conductance mechanosensitive channel protein MscL [Candidatus Onthocola stercoravium]|nr:large conductance mechanosensitive channel protein MscL [Candidatus Onthocola stercoravium]
MIKEFKKFIARGNVLDLAVGVIVGGAFSSIVTSLVNNIFTPIIGLILGGVDFSNLSITFRDTQIMYGAFIQSVIDFLIVAFCLFIVVKVVNKVTAKKEKKEEKKDTKSAELKTLEEIRDILKNDIQSK